MKKLILSLAAIALLTLTSCEKKACYEFTVTMTGLGDNSEMQYYIYCTEDEATTYKQQYTTPTSTCTMKKVNKAESDCNNLK